MQLGPTTTLGIRDPRSLGISRYVARLAMAMGERGERYVPADAPRAGTRLHFHLGNSSRRVVGQSMRAERPFVVTVHDVLPRTRALTPVYRGAVYPFCVRRAAGVVVHSQFARDLLASSAGLRRERITVIAFPATDPLGPLDREHARRELGLADGGPPLFVLPGVAKGAKLVDEVLAAAEPLVGERRLQLMLVGPAVDPTTTTAARTAGATLLVSPDDASYDRAIVAADCVINLRSDSVGESNGPLMDAIGAHRAVLATDVGSIREIAGAAATFVSAPTSAAIAAGMRGMLDPAVRAARERAAGERAAQLTWSASAACHAELFAEIYAS
jgi:glycosyltransferase involved in cell wall biosynthesis